MCIQTHGSICTAPRRFTVVLEKTKTNQKQKDHVLCSHFVFCKEASSYEGADWLSSFDIQRMARGQLCVKLYRSVNVKISTF